MKKKLTAIIAIAAMIATMIPSMAFADSVTPVEVGDLNSLKTALADSSVKEIKLTADIDFGSSWWVYLNNREITVDLNEKTITTSGKGFVLKEGAKATVKNGTLNATGSAKLFMSDGNGSVANTIIVDDVTATAENYCVIYHNGNNYGANVEVKNSTLTSDEAVIFLSGNDGFGEKRNELSIIGSTITSNNSTAVEVKVGNVIVEDSSLRACEDVAERDSGNGSCTNGYAIAITNNSNGSSVEKSKGSVMIKSGNFVGTVGIKDEHDSAETAKIEIQGGNFDSDVRAYLAKDAKIVKNSDGTYSVVVEKTPEQGSNVPERPQDSPNTGDNNMAPFAVAGLALAAMAAVAVARRRYN